MKKFFNGLQWLALLGVIAGITWLVLKPSPPVVYSPETWSNWDGFMVLSYAGVTRDDSAIYPSSETLISHLEALKQVGYNTITPEDALAFLEGRFPLPSKALLILFEGARKETFIRAHPALRRLGMRATLCVPTASVESWDESRLKERDIRKIALLPQWNLASMGREAIEPIKVSEAGATDHFLSVRKWLPKMKRVETDEEFRKRIEEDYRASSELMGKLNGSPVAAYVYPFADDGRRVGADPLAGQLNTANVTSFYHMAFVSASNPYNPPGRDPYGLSRLRVGGDWSAAQVLTRLQHACPLTVASAGIESYEHWSYLNGARVVGSLLKLDSGDAAWIRGSDFWMDASISVVLSRSPGTVAVLYARFVDPAHCLRLSVDEKTVRLQESQSGGAVTLAVAAAPPGETLKVVWRVKGLRAWVSVNGLPVLGPVPLAKPPPSGIIGFESNRGQMSIAELSVVPIRRQGLVAESWGAIPDEQRHPVTEFLAPFPAGGKEVSAQQSLDYIQAVAEGATIWSILTPETNGPAVEPKIQSMTAMLGGKDLTSFIKGFVLEASQSEWVEPLRRQGFKVMHRVKAGEAIPLAATNRVDYVWLEESGSNGVAAAKAFLHRHSFSQLMVEDEFIMTRYPGVGKITKWTASGGKLP
jgi:peptidoglycan/xylan/chitin deacetylase (PgdA/CDA1 family)